MSNGQQGCSRSLRKAAVVVKCSANILARQHTGVLHLNSEDMRGHLEADAILMCATHKSWRIEIPPDLLHSDPAFPPLQFPARPVTLHLHSGFSSLASRAGVDLSSTELTAEGLSQTLEGAKAVIFADVPSGLALVEAASVVCLSTNGVDTTGLDPSQIKAAEAWRSAARARASRFCTVFETCHDERHPHCVW